MVGQTHRTLLTVSLLQSTGGTEGSSLVPELTLLAGQAGGQVREVRHHRPVKRSPEAEPGAGGSGVVTFSVTASLDTLRQKLLWSLQNSNRNVTEPGRREKEELMNILHFYRLGDRT